MPKIQWLLVVSVVLLGTTDSLRAEISIDTLIEQARISEGDVAVRDLPRWQGAKRVLVRDLGFDPDGIRAAAPGAEFIFVTSAADAMKHIGDVDAIIGFCSSELMAAAKNLVWVQVYWAGAERCLAVSEVADGSVVMTNMQKMSSPVIAEHAIAMMMALARNLPRFGHAMADGDWAASPEMRANMMSIAGKKMLVAGLGGIGSEVARLGDALGMHVSGTRNSSRKGPGYVEYVGLAHELNELAAEADVVVNALPLTDGTKDLFDAEFFAAIKPGALFINVGRGQTVVTDDLIAALESGQVAAAGLDVTEPEPLPSMNALWQRDDVIITPHVSGSGGERERHTALLLENLRRYVAGDALLNVVDPARGY